MSTLRSILLHLDASRRSAVRLQLARELALAHRARVDALYATTPSVFSVPFAMGEGAVQVMPVLQRLDEDRRSVAKARFDAALVGSDASLRWRELDNEPVIPGFARRALWADLMVLGQHNADDPLTDGVPSDFVASALMASGRPALVVPYVGEWPSPGNEVLIAWKPTRESARAVSSALPVLQRARRLHLTAAEGDDAAAGLADLEDYVRLHGVQAPVVRHGPVPTEEPGEGLLSLAADTGADLLVMGCYGHSRARELVLGGATRTVLNEMTLPVWMAH